VGLAKVNGIDRRLRLSHSRDKRDDKESNQFHGLNH
jgi:hypothetical protein